MSDALFPPLEPYASGWLERDEGHRIWYEQSGNPQGAPVVFLHGGPGSSTNPDHRRFFDPAFYRIVLLDQRGCGRSTPRGEIRANTTPHLLSDLERLRLELEIRRWLLFGGSWGSTLALAYAQAHPEIVSGLVLRGLFLASEDEVSWFVTGLSRFLPEAWSTFAASGDDQSCAGLLRRYHERIVLDDVAAAARWNAWESAVMAVGEAPPASAAADMATLARVRVQLHYLVNGCFLAPGQLLHGLDALLGCRRSWCKAAAIWFALRAPRTLSRDTGRGAAADDGGGRPLVDASCHGARPGPGHARYEASDRADMSLRFRINLIITVVIVLFSLVTAKIVLDDTAPLRSARRWRRTPRSRSSC